MDGQPLTILVVEGRECDADLYFRVLGLRWPAVRLTWVNTLRSALEFLSTRSPDAILLDMQLPDSSGLESLARVHERASNVPIVVLTELSDEPLGLQSIRMGAQDYLAKIALNGDILERCLRYAIERMRLVNSIRQRDAELAHLSRLITLGEMASGLAHELKQPLTAIKNYSEASIYRLATEGEGAVLRVTENLSAMSRQASHASTILRHMKSFVEKSIPSAEVASLAEAVSDSLSLLDHELRRENVDVVLQLDPHVPPVRVEPIQIKQIVLNLIRNAIEAVSVPESTRREITLRAFVRDEKEAVLVVSDTGPGIDPEYERKIFEPFYSTKDGGMGMGLAICTSILNAYGGQITARRRPKGGAEIRVSLPLARDDSGEVSTIADTVQSDTMRDFSTTIEAAATTSSA